MNKKLWGGIVLLVAVAAVCASLLLAGRQAKSYSATAMGTGARITLVGTRLDGLTGRLDRLAAKAFAEIEGVEGLMSLFREGSDIWRLNRAGHGNDVPVDERTHGLLRAALRMSEVTGGVFNICLLPLEQAWGFKGDGKRAVPKATVRLPRPSGELLALKERGGDWYARLLEDGVKVDLGGIGKGYAIDRAAAVLRDAGLYGALVDIGGDGYCLGRSVRGVPWRMGLRKPRGPGVFTVLELSDKAVATSGDYENFFIDEGKRYGHIFDPRSGRPAESGLVSATVIAGSCTEADGLATALMVLGRKEGTALIEKLPGVECILIGGGDKLTFSTSSGWKL